MGVYLDKPATEAESIDFDLPHYRVGASSMQGWRTSQEDDLCCIPDFDPSRRTSLFAVFDGHGGNDVARYAAKYFPQILLQTAGYKEGDLESALKEAFLDTDRRLLTTDAQAELRILSGDKADSGDASDSADDENVDQLLEEAEKPLEELVGEDFVSDRPIPSKSGQTSGGNLLTQLFMNRFFAATMETSEGTTQVTSICSSEAVSVETNDAASDQHKKESESKSHLMSSANVIHSGGDSGGGDAKQEQSVESLTNGNVGDGAPGGQSSERATNSANSSTHPVGSTSKSTVDAASRPLRGHKEAKTADGEEEDDEENDADYNDDDGEEDEDEEEDEEGSDSDEDDDDDDDDDDVVMPNFDFADDHTNEESGDASSGTQAQANKHSMLAVDMSCDHKPEDTDERRRIEAAGSIVSAQGRVNGGLNLSRAIGDHCYKQTPNLPLSEQAITALPDVRQMNLVERRARFIVIACDGIWNSFTSQQVCDFIAARLPPVSAERSCAERPAVECPTTPHPTPASSNSTDTDAAPSAPSACSPDASCGAVRLSSICEQLFHHCLAPDTTGDGTGCDNMTAIIIQLKPSASSAAGDGESAAPHGSGDHDHDQARDGDAERSEANRKRSGASRSPPGPIKRSRVEE